MNNREWFCLALRLLGVWRLVDGVAYLPLTISDILPVGPLGLESLSLSGLIWPATQITIGLFLLIFANVLGVLIYRETAPDNSAAAQYSPKQFLEVGLGLMGVWMLANAARTLLLSLGRTILSSHYTGRPWNDNWPSSDLGSLMSSGLEAVIALVLLLGPRRVIELIDRLRYVPTRDAYTPAEIEPPSPDAADAD